MSESQDLLVAGQSIQLKRDSYRVVRKLGAGGYGTVWLVESETTQKQYALKTINPYQSHNNNASWRSLGEINNIIEYTEKEVAFLERLGRKAADHYIIAMQDSGVWQHPELPDQDLPIFVMDVYGKGDLSRYCRAYPKSKPYNAADFLRWAEQIAGALAYLHDQYHDGTPCVHRDIKPANVLLNSEYDAGLTDFGIARTSSGTGTSTSAYSRHFCAPEQVLAIYKTTQGHSRYLITPAVDIYSFGILLHELLSGSTEAQERLGSSTEIESHNKHLLLTDAGQFEAVGQLGVIGGLNPQEEAHLLRTLESLFNPVDENATLIGGSGAQQAALPSAVHLAKRYVHLQQRMLSPWVHDRPSAKQLIDDFAELRSAFEPELAHLSITPVQDTHALGAPLALKVSFQGRGLTAPADWLRFEMNHRMQHDVEIENSGDDWLFDTNKVHTVIATLPSPSEVGDYRVDVFAQVGDETHNAEITVSLLLSAEKLWEQKQYLLALKQELRPEWLEERLQQVSNINDVLAFNGLLAGLKARWGDHPLLAEYEEKLRNRSLQGDQSAIKQPEKTVTPPPRKPQPPKRIEPVVETSESDVEPAAESKKSRAWLWLLLALPLAGAAGFYGFKQLSKPKPQPIPTIPAQQTEITTDETEMDETETDDLDISETPLDVLNSGNILIPATELVRAGKFNMGCVSVRDAVNGLKCQRDEMPPVKKTVFPFDMSTHEITVAQYRDFVRDTNRPKPDSCWIVNTKGQWKEEQGYHWGNTGFPQNDNSPVTCVSVQDAKDYLAWLSKKTGDKWRLPTEVEWEHAARAGGEAPYYWGTNPNDMCQHANGTDVSVSRRFPRWRTDKCNDGYTFTAPVGSFKPNAWGFYDMLGNVWEWTDSCYDKGTKYCRGEYVRRGGSWSSNHQFLRAAGRFRTEDYKRVVDIGFRAVREWD